MLDPALREIIVTSAWEHLPMTVSDSEMPGFQIAVSELSSLKPEIGVMEPHICKLTQDENAVISLSSYDPAEMADRQREDPDMVYLRQYLESGTLSTEGDLMISSPEAKCYILERDCFCLDENEVIWRRADESDETKRLLTPRNLRSEVMHLCYDILSSGYQGFRELRSG